MHFDKDTLLVRCKLSQDQVKHLHARQRGGESGALGYRYQERYALLRATELCHEKNDVLIGMEALCPVDDVVIEDGGLHEHAQCKISATLSWDRKLVREFRLQHSLFRRLGRTRYRLLLVVADATAGAKLQTHARRELRSRTSRKTEVVHFPHADPENQVWRVPRFARALDKLLPPLLRTPSDREALYKELKHVLETSPGWPGTSVSTRSMMARVAGHQALSIALPSSLRSAWSVSDAEWEEAQSALAQIPGFEMMTDGGVCCYRCGFDSGVIARCDTRRFQRFVHDVIARRPRTMEDFFEVRPV